MQVMNSESLGRLLVKDTETSNRAYCTVNTHCTLRTYLGEFTYVRLPGHFSDRQELLKNEFEGAINIEILPPSYKPQCRLLSPYYLRLRLLCFTTLHYTVLYYTPLYCAVLHSTILCCVVLQVISLQYAEIAGIMRQPCKEL